MAHILGEGDRALEWARDARKRAEQAQTDAQNARKRRTKSQAEAEASQERVNDLRRHRRRSRTS